MLEKLAHIVEVFFSNFADFCVVGFAVVSAIIFIIGILKHFAFDKIKTKLVRKVSIAMTDVAFSFGGTAVAYWIEDVNFGSYIVGACAVFVATIVVYWLYENTLLRDAIHKTGHFFTCAFLKAAVKALNGEKTIGKADFAEVIKTETKKNMKIDKDLTNL